MIDKPSTEKLKRFVEGELDADETERMLTYLAQDDEALDVVDELWQEISFASIDEDGQVPELDDATAQEVERLLFDRIHRTDLTGDVLRLSTQAASAVYWALLRPFVTRLAGSNDEIEELDNRRRRDGN
jgi:anti-sigma factor RsiW